MFSGLFSARLKAAEIALKQGRLDDAFRVATEPDVRSHRRATRVLAQLTDRFIQRAREHFAAERFAEALLDLEKADAGGTQPDRVAELRQQIRVVAEEVYRQGQSRHGRLAEARQRIAMGSLDAGRRILEKSPPDDTEAERLRREADHRKEQADAMFADIERLLAQDQLAPAAERLRRARALHPHAPASAELESKLCAAALARANEAFATGRPARAAASVAALADLGRHLPARQEIDDALRRVKTAADALHAYRFDDARQAMLRLCTLYPKVDWIHRTADALKIMDDTMLSLLSGPLAEWADTQPPSPAEHAVVRDAVRRAELADTIALNRPAVSPGTLADGLLLLVDGGGSYLLHRGGRVTIGRAASHDPADIAIYSDLAERHAELARIGDDYFLFSTRPVEVNGAATRQALLQDGDRLTIGRKARLAFRVPSRKSATATLDLSDGTKMPDDVRRVILFHGHARIGAGPTAHVRCDAAVRPLILFERSGRLWVRPEGRGAPDEAWPVPIGESIDVGGATFVVKEARKQGA